MTARALFDCYPTVEMSSIMENKNFGKRKHTRAYSVLLSASKAVGEWRSKDWINIILTNMTGDKDGTWIKDARVLFVISISKQKGQTVYFSWIDSVEVRPNGSKIIVAIQEMYSQWNDILDKSSP